MNTHSTSLLCFSAAALLALPFSLTAQSVSVDFNSATSLTDNLNKGQLADDSDGVGFDPSGDVIYSAGTGLSGSGGGKTPPQFTDIFGYNTKTAFDSTFASSTISTYFQVKDGKNTGGGLALNVGFSSLAAVEFGNGSTSTGASTGLVDPTPQNAVNQYSFAITLREEAAASFDGVADLYQIVGSNNASASGIDSSDKVSLAIGGWYFWESTIVRTGNDYAIESNVFASDTSGTIAGSAVISHSFTVTNADLVAAGDVYGYISSQNGDRRGIDQLDDLSFNAIPEPAASTAIFGLGVLLIASMSRRRK